MKEVSFEKSLGEFDELDYSLGSTTAWSTRVSLPKPLQLVIN
jgi:hypothetical protein